MDDLISRAAVLEELADLYWTEERFLTFKDVDSVFDRIKALPSAQPEKRTNECTETHDKRTGTHACDLPSAQLEQRWISCSERLPEINQTVLLSTTDGEVIVGYRYKPDIVWQVTANDGRKIWVYDPENYPGNIDELPKAETCGFEDRDNCWLSVTSINYDLKFAGISAWMPLPEPYKGG